MMSFVDLIGPEQKFLIQDVESACKVVRLFWEFSWEQIRQEDNFGLSGREMSLAWTHQATNRLDHVRCEFGIEICLLLARHKACHALFFLAKNVKWGCHRCGTNNKSNLVRNASLSLSDFILVESSLLLKRVILPFA